jgi:hypothetical protein
VFSFFKKNRYISSPGVTYQALAIGAAQSIVRVREQETKVRNLEAAVADLEIQREENRKLALVAEAEKNNLARQNVIVRERAGRDRELRALATGQTDVDRAFMESEYAKSKATELRALADFTELKARHEMLGAVCALSATYADVC